MSVIEWKDEYSVNHEIIDEQHKKLIDMINELNRAMEMKSGGSVIDSIMKELSDYTFYHFSFEESYMEKIGFPEFEEHRGCHEKLRKKVYDIFNHFYTDQTVTQKDIYGFLKDWWIGHILEKDQCYKKFAESKSE